MRRAILAFATLVAFSQAATAGVPLFGHVSCALVRFYVAKYSAVAAEKWARSHGASDAEIETARRCLHIETASVTAKQVLAPVTQHERARNEPAKPDPAQDVLHVLPEQGQHADPEQANQDTGVHGSVRPKDIDHGSAGHVSNGTKELARAEGNITALPTRHIGAMLHAKRVGVKGHTSWLKRVWDHLTRRRQFSIAFLHFRGDRR